MYIFVSLDVEILATIMAKYKKITAGMYVIIMCYMCFRAILHFAVS